MYDFILVANGTSQRFGSNKLLVKHEGDYLINFLIKKIINISSINNIILVSNEKIFEKVIENEKIIHVLGGNSRQESVLKGLFKVITEKVLIHDAARPYVSETLILNIIDNLNIWKCVVPVLPVVDCLKHNGNTVKREEFFLSQTPQGMETNLIKKAYEISNENFYDEAHAIEIYNSEIKIKYIQGEKNNLKLTFKEDLL